MEEKELYKEYVFDTLNKQTVEKIKEDNLIYLTFPNYFNERIYIDHTGISSNQYSDDNLVKFLNKLKEGIEVYVRNKGYDFDGYGWNKKDNEILFLAIVEWFNEYVKKTPI